MKTINTSPLHVIFFQRITINQSILKKYVDIPPSVMPDTSKIKYCKHNRVCFNSLEARDKGRMMFIEFFDSIKTQELGKEMIGHIILDSESDDPLESLILTFWKTSEDMDKFYSAENKALARLVERAKPLFEKMPERTDYAVPELLL
ncbi:MAG: hypothetical protein M3261_07490 [Thermoproteota archaeon]|nr:hypothetical protein [Thermoproteota archaeon]